MSDETKKIAVIAPQKKNPGRHKTTPELEKFKEREMKLVKGMFRNRETPGGKLMFSARAFPNEKIKKWEFEDGKIYEVPRYIARRIASETSIAQYAYTLNEKGLPVMISAPAAPRFGFESVEFMEDTTYGHSTIIAPFGKQLDPL